MGKHPQGLVPSRNWAFAQLGVGVSDISPRTTLETYFCILIAPGFGIVISCISRLRNQNSKGIKPNYEKCLQRSMLSISCAGFPVAHHLHYADQSHDIVDDCADQSEGG